MNDVTRSSLHNCLVNYRFATRAERRGRYERLGNYDQTFEQVCYQRCRNLDLVLLAEHPPRHVAGCRKMACSSSGSNRRPSVTILMFMSIRLPSCFLLFWLFVVVEPFFSFIHIRAGKPGMEVQIGGLLFTSAFDSGNMANVVTASSKGWAFRCSGSRSRYLHSSTSSSWIGAPNYSLNVP